MDFSESRVVLRDGSWVRLRTLDPGDSEALAACFAGFSAEARRVFHPHAFDADEARARCEAAYDPERRVLVADTSGSDAAIVGYGFWFAWRGDAPLLGLGVPDAWQGRGVGPALLEALVGMARVAGKARGRLSVYKENDRALRLYGAVGFVIDGETDDGLQWTMSAVLSGT